MFFPFGARTTFILTYRYLSLTFYIIQPPTNLHEKTPVILDEKVRYCCGRLHLKHATCFTVLTLIYERLMMYQPVLL